LYLKDTTINYIGVVQITSSEIYAKRRTVKVTIKYRGYDDVLLGKAFAQFMEQ
jgi:hypothetical protein